MMRLNEEHEIIRDLSEEFKGGRMTRGAFVTKAIAAGLSLTVIERLLTTNPVFASSKAESELRASGKTLQYWTPFGGADGPHMLLMTQQYNAKNPGYYFNLVRVGGGYETKMTSAAISHTLPDVAAYRLDWIPDAVARGIFENIDDIASANHISASDFAPAVWAGGIQGGHRYSIPLDTHVATYFYNKSLLSKIGMSSAPTNRSQFDAMTKAAVKAGMAAFPVSINWPLPLQFSTFLWQAGGQLFSDDKTKAVYNSAAGVRALSFLVGLVQSGASPKSLSDEGNVLFLTKKATTWVDGIWWLQGVKDAHFDFGAGPVPTLFDKPAAWSGSHQLVLPKKSRSADERTAIGKFMTYIVSNSAEWARGGQVPASASVRASAVFKAIQPQATIATEEPYVHFVDPFPGASQAYYGPFSKYGALAIAGKMSVKAALDAAAALSTKTLTAARASLSSNSGD